MRYLSGRRGVAEDVAHAVAFWPHRLICIDISELGSYIIYLINLGGPYRWPECPVEKYQIEHEQLFDKTLDLFKIRGQRIQHIHKYYATAISLGSQRLIDGPCAC